MRSFLILLAFLFSIAGEAQDMTAEKINSLIESVSDSASYQNNTVRFNYKNRMLICVTDEKANRMRIISPIAERAQLKEEHLLNALVANFHTALDVKYAISDELIWSVFAHPLKELSEAQVKDAILQVYYANVTFGNTYSSTTLVFPGNTQKKESKPAPVKKKI
ncbi:hypothetical protein ACJD0Z_10860 [Flavobacteriaceae bacterium M23B6Z8]